VVKLELGEKFEMKDLGEAKWILQILIERKTIDGTRVLTISQEQYVENILKRHQMDKCNPVNTPMAANLQLPVLAAPEVDVTEYQKCIGSLMYLMVCTRPDIAYAVGVLSRHVSAPGPDHMAAVKRVFRYLRGTSQYKLMYWNRDDECTLPEVYVDADWAGDRTDRKSVTGFGVRMGEGLVSWASKKQNCVSLSTVEAEFVAAASATQEAIWVRSVLESIGYRLVSEKAATFLYIDNQGALDLIKTGNLNERTKHIETKYRFICDRYENDDILPVHIPTATKLPTSLPSPSRLPSSWFPQAHWCKS
jgi:hypothetical protein